MTEAPGKAATRGDSRTPRVLDAPRDVRRRRVRLRDGDSAKVLVRDLWCPPASGRPQRRICPRRARDRATSGPGIPAGGRPQRIRQKPGDFAAPLSPHATVAW